MSNLSFLPSNVDDLMDMSFNEEFNELVASSEALMDQVAGTEAITSSVDQEVKAARDARVQACNGNQDGGNLDDKLLIDLKVDKDGKAKAYVYLYNWFGNKVEAKLITLLENAKEDDEIHLFINCCHCWDNYGFEYAVANSIMTSKATVHTYCSYTDELQNFIIWLSGDVVHVGGLAWIRVAGMVGGMGGFLHDVDITMEQFHREENKIFKWMVGIGFLTEEEVDKIMTYQGEICLFGKDLVERIDAVNKFNANRTVTE